MRGYLVTEGGLCRGEGRLRDEFVVLFVLSHRSASIAVGREEIRGPTYTDGLEDGDEPRKVGHSVVECLDGRLEEFEGCSEGGYAVGVGCGVGGHCWQPGECASTAIVNSRRFVSTR